MGSLGLQENGGQNTQTDQFARFNGCTITTLPRAPTGGHVCTDYMGCPAGKPVRWCSYDGGHTPSPVTWNDFVTYTQFYDEFLAAAREAIKKGVSPEAFAKAWQLPAKYKGFQADPARVLANAQAIWAETK